jgi:PHB/PHA accumulation regulator DNA-binding domain
MAVTVRHFKKYTNRKHYDLDRGRYVSLLDVGDVIADGEEIEVICDRTGRDLTFETLARTLHERTRAYFSSMSRRGRVAEEPIPREAISKLVRLIPYSTKPAPKRRKGIAG